MIELRDVTVTYQPTTPLKNLSLSFEAGPTVVMGAEREREVDVVASHRGAADARLRLGGDQRSASCAAELEIGR